jgi:predicted GIY-YIG superfamily endonuclease
MEYFYVYMLKCNDDAYYVGHTDNIENRIAQHNAGLSSYTSIRLPIKLVFIELFQTRDEAFIIERKVKSWSRKKKEALIDQNWSKLNTHAKKKF